MAARRVILHIDHLRLHGVPTGDVRSLARAFEIALQHSLTRELDRGGSMVTGSRAELRLGRVHASSVLDPRTSGRSFGQALAEGLLI